MSGIALKNLFSLTDPFGPPSPAFRAFWTINGMVRPPDEVYTDPQVVACTRDAVSQHGSGPPVAQPTRAHLLAALTA